MAEWAGIPEKEVPRKYTVSNNPPQKTYKDPLVSCNVKVAISDVFNIFDIEPGDYITLNSAEKQINQSIKVLEYTVNLTDNTVSISLGNSIFREVMPKIYRFK